MANARDEYERHQRKNKEVIDKLAQERLLALTNHFKQIWDDTDTPNRERKRMLAYIVEDVTLIKDNGKRTTTCHVRFKGGKTETLIAGNPKSPAQQVKTPSDIVNLVDRLLDDYTYSEIAKRLNERGMRPGGTARQGCHNKKFTSKRVAYIVHRYNLQMRYDRLRKRGMLTKEEMAQCLGIHSLTVTRWAEFGILKRHAYNDHWYLYEPPSSDTPPKQCSRWNTLADRVKKMHTTTKNNQTATLRSKEV